MEEPFASQELILEDKVDLSVKRCGYVSLASVFRETG